MNVFHFRIWTPPVLYKYLDVEGACKTLSPDGSARVLFSRPNTFNDPFDCCPAGCELGSNRKLRKTIIRVLKENEKSARAECEKLGWKYEEVVNDYRSGKRPLDSHRNALLNSDGREYQNDFAKKATILSLSSGYDNLAMWSYYAHNHEGIVLGIRTRSFIPLDVYPVEYSWKRPRIGEKSDHDNIRKFTVKAPVWGHEHEWRVVAIDEYMRFCREFRGLPNWTDERILWEIEPANIDSVRLGVRCRDSSLLHRIEQFGTANPLCRILQAEQDRNKFRLHFANRRINKCKRSDAQVVHPSLKSHLAFQGQGNALRAMPCFQSMIAVACYDSSAFCHAP